MSFAESLSTVKKLIKYVQIDLVKYIYAFLMLRCQSTVCTQF